jgi:UDPglucose 6-dehydrogenase
VGTPSGEDGSADLQYVLAVAKDIAEELEKIGPTAKSKVIVVKSTVPVGTSHKVRDAIRARTKIAFHIADNPEFLKEGDAIGDFMKPDRVVCGVESEHAGEILRELYEPFVRQGNPIFIMDVRSAEMVKYASNAMLACKISFINEIANLCERYGADINNVREGMCADRRIGNQFLYPGLGYGGSCFPKDTLAVVGMGKEVGFDCKLNASVHEVNQDQRGHFWQKIEKEFAGGLSGKKLAFWGVAFKPRTDDIRQAPSIALMERAIKAGARVRAFDPVALEHLAREMTSVEIATDMYQCLEGADALVVCTEWSDFRSPDWDRVKELLSAPLIFDGRNLYRAHSMQEHGFDYVSIGRATVRGAAKSRS